VEVQTLKTTLKLNSRALEEYKEMMRKMLNNLKGLDLIKEERESGTSPSKRDDDTHYFRSYSENGLVSQYIRTIDKSK